MEIEASRKNFIFEMDILGSTKRPTTINKLAVTALKRLLNPSFNTVDIFALVVTYLFTV